uniref:G-protein coupled receptors family 1 profile domain-containing protein n=1 Tax=Panagrolaimus davidi TaxID=227884 RepID=A0A914PCK9_9BILA
MSIFKIKQNVYIQLVLLINLSDVAVGIGSLLQAIFRTLGQDSYLRTKFECHLINLPLYFGASTEHWILIALAIDRLLALLYPIHYFANKFENFPLITAVITLALTVIYLICNVIDVNLFEVVKDCSIHVTRGSIGITYSYFAGVIILGGTIGMFLDAPHKSAN